MKRLYLLRHAKAQHAQGEKDFDRPLAQEGILDADALGKTMVKKSYNPAMIYCSPALRTKQTLDNLRLQPLQAPKFEESIYDASAGGLLDLIHDSDDGLDSIMIIGHNPALHELALRLTSDESAASLLQRLLQGYRPATLSVLDCPNQCWNDLQLGENSLTDLLDPMDYNAPDRPTRWM